MENKLKSIASQIKNKRLLVAVSGGADSMVLLNLLKNLQKDINFYIKVIHINHNLRGSESDADAEFVKTYCDRSNIDCSIESVDVLSYKDKNKQTIEQAARELRYNAIFNLKKQEKFDYILTAHNLDDQVETVLMNLCRGCGLSGAMGIKPRKEIIRPLLSVSKSEIKDQFWPHTPQ